jgi:choline dehydrogenase
MVAELPVGAHLLDHPMAYLLLPLHEGARVATERDRHTNVCLRYSSGMAGAGENDMIMIAMNVGGGRMGQRLESGLIGVSVYQSWSEGSVRITTADAAIDPEVEERFLSDERDLRRMRDGVRRLLAIGGHEAVRSISSGPLLIGSAIAPGSVIEDADIDAWMMAAVADIQHGSGTCRMGASDDPRSVVDADCRVNGFEGLHVIDASIMPEIPRANTHLSTVMIGELMSARLRQ